MEKLIKVTKILLGSLALLVSLGLIFITIMIFYVKDHERDLPIVPLFIKTFNLFEQEIDVKFSSSKIKFDSNKNEFKWEIQNLKAIDGENKNPLLDIKQVNLSINILNVMSNNHILREIILDSPKIYLYGTEEAIEHKIGHQEFNKINHFKALSRLSSHIIKLFGMKIKVNDGCINFIKSNNQITWNINNLESQRTGNYYHIVGEALFDDNKSKFELGANIKDVQSEIALKFFQFPFTVAAELIDSNFLKKLFTNFNKKLMANGSMNILISDEPDIKYIDGQIESIKFENSDNISDQPIISDSKIKFTYRDKLINVDEVSFKFQNNSDFNFSSKIDLDENYSFKKLNMDCNINNLPVESAKFLWPDHLIPDVRIWLLDHLNQGKINKGYLNIKELILNDHKQAANDNFKAELLFEKVGLKSIDYLPEIKNIDGVAEFDNESIRIKIGSGQLENIKLSNALINIEYPQENKISYLVLKSDMNGPVNSYNSLVPEELFKLGKYKIDLKASGGNANGNFTLKLPLVDNLQIKDIDYESILKVSNANIFKPFPKYLLRTDNLKIKHADNNFELTSSGQVSNIPYDINISSLDQQESKILSRFYFNNNNIKLIDPDLKYVELIHGNIPVTLEDEGSKIKISADLSGAQLNIDTINYRKSIGSKLNLFCVSEIKDNDLIMEKISLIGEDVKIENGSGIIDQDFILSKLDLKKIKIANNLFNLSLMNNLNNQIIKIDGSKLDLSRIDFSSLSNKNNEQAINKAIEVKLDKIIMKNNEEYYDALLKMECNYGKSCQTFDFDTNLKDNHFIKIVNSKISDHEQEINVYSDNASLLLRSLNIYNNIDGGKKFIAEIKRITVPLKDKNNFETNYSGNIRIDNFVSSKNSALAMIILTLTSPQNIGDIGGKGNILMKDFQMDFVGSHGIISIKNGNANGNSLQLTLSGIVDTNKKTLDLKGNFIPSVMGINKIISLLPVFGKGEAVIAATYHINGNFDDPKVSINPLSLLTPGFLRNIFQ